MVVALRYFLPVLQQPQVQAGHGLPQRLQQGSAMNPVIHPEPQCRVKSPPIRTYHEYARLSRVPLPRRQDGRTGGPCLFAYVRTVERPRRASLKAPTPEAQASLASGVVTFKAPSGPDDSCIEVPSGFEPLYKVLQTSA